MANEKESTSIEYSKEDIDLIKDLTSYFNIAPGQIVPEGQNMDEDNYEELAQAEQDELSDEDAESEDLSPEDDFPKLSFKDDGDQELENLLNTEILSSDDGMLGISSKKTSNTPSDDSSALVDLGTTSDLDITASDDFSADVDATSDDLSADLVSEIGDNDSLSDGLDFDLSAPEIPNISASDSLGDLDTFNQDVTNFNDILRGGGNEGFSADLSQLDMPEDSVAVDLPPAVEEGSLPPPADDFSLPEIDSQSDFAEPSFDETSLDESSLGEHSFSEDDFSFDGMGAESEKEMPDKVPAFDFPPQQETETDDLDFAPPSLAELSPQKAISSATKTSSFYASEDLTDEELQATQNALKSFPYALRKAFVDAILGNRLNLIDTREVIAELISGARPESVKKMLEEKLGEPIDMQKGAEFSRAIFSRETYTNVGLERQAKLIRRTRYTALAAFVLLLVGNLSYFYIYKPIRYNTLISWGKQVIETRAGNFEKAEEYFSTAVDIFPRKSKAYLQFGESYKKIGEYQKAFVKLFGDVSLIQDNKAVRYEDQELKSADSLWSILKKVPIVRYADTGQKDSVLINNIPFHINQKGAYLLTHLDTSTDDANTLLALAAFHSNPVKRFKDSPYRNNLLSLDYYQRVLTFKTNASLMSQENYGNQAIEGIGNVYYQQKDYYRAQSYFEKIIRQDPYNSIGQSGALRSLLKIYQNTNDPRLIIQRHTEIRNNLKIENKLPFYMLAALAAFYIDLPDDDSLRIQYNVSPIDHTDNKKLKERSIELLDILFKGKETDIYGNKKEGKYFAEGFYQRGRYYRLTQKQVRMALKQMEYAYLYDPRHFLALSARGEMLLDLQDYAGAMEHFRLALSQITPDKLELLGERPEDETLLDADFGGIYFNMGKALYLTTLNDLGSTSDWTRIQETQRYNSDTNYGIQGLSEMLDQTDTYFQKAQNLGIKDNEKRLQLAYYNGWSWYARGNFRKALQYWESIEPNRQRDFNNLDLAKANALYRLAQLEPQNKQTHLRAALGYLLFLQGKYNQRAVQLGKPSATAKENLILFSRIASVENNIGAVYELLGDQESSLRHYWLAVDASKKVGRENEVANLNIQLNFKRDSLAGKERFPVILDFVSPLLENKS